ncbi:sugar phosphate isomerase/epimerase family protein [Cohnella rhizosphaerae]|uniref:Sugar phosphate isomerase/epimerase n=1 Tax=Cohnella rhizosphaerae TaxID=1457232 RepID=A0A9X4L3Y0_9BACL|nr:TIM barrel protein [Cohnella rhizosphaerae]MDG0813309.1 sugar phosphate isomerase/epimerase [Cohnella rhizosphaerae]
MGWGIGSYSLAWAIGVPGYEPPKRPLTARELLAAAKDAGAGVVQYADNLPLHELPEAELDELVRRARALGIALEVGLRGTAPASLTLYADLALRIGSPLVRTLITEPDIRSAYRDLEATLPIYESKGIVLAIENHGLHTTDQLAALFAHFDSPSLGCCLDTVNSFGALESPDAVIRALAPYTASLHVKDFDIQRVDHQMGFTVLGTPTGQGRLNWSLLREELQKSRRRPNWIIELWTPFAGSVERTIELEREWFEASVTFVRGEWKA